jgi:hypothetical protein
VAVRVVAKSVLKPIIKIRHRLIRLQRW